MFWNNTPVPSASEDVTQSENEESPAVQSEDEAEVKKCEYPELITIKIYTNLNEINNPEVKINIDKNNGSRYEVTDLSKWETINYRNFNSTIDQYIKNKYKDEHSCFSDAFNYNYIVNKPIFQRDRQSNINESISNLTKVYYSGNKNGKYKNDEDLKNFILFLKQNEGVDIHSLFYNQKPARNFYNIYMAKTQTQQDIDEAIKSESDSVEHLYLNIAEKIYELKEKITNPQQKEYLEGLLESTSLSDTSKSKFINIKKNITRYLKNINSLEQNIEGTNPSSIMQKKMGKKYIYTITDLEKALINTSLFGGKTLKNKKSKSKKNKTKTKKN